MRPAAVLSFICGIIQERLLPKGTVQVHPPPPPPFVSRASLIVPMPVKEGNVLTKVASVIQLRLHDKGLDKFSCLVGFCNGLFNFILVFLANAFLYTGSEQSNGYNRAALKSSCQQEQHYLVP